MPPKGSHHLEDPRSHKPAIQLVSPPHSALAGTS
jgi:hypothetical protein